MQRLLGATAAALTLLTAPVLAESSAAQTPAHTAARTATQTAAQTASLSAELFLAGVEADDPILLIAAAKLRKTLHLKQVERSPDKDMGLPEMDEVGLVGWEDILDVAVAMAPEDEVIIALAEDIRTEKDKGVRSGQLYSITGIRNGGTDTYPPMTYRGSEYADVYVEGSGHADLNLFVYDAQNRLVCSDTDISAIAHCGWTPSQDASFTIVVRNRGRGDSGYSLITN